MRSIKKYNRKLRTKLRNKSRTKSRTKLRGKSRTKLRGKSKKLHQTGGAWLWRKKKQTHSVDISNISSKNILDILSKTSSELYTNGININTTTTNLEEDYNLFNVDNPRLYVHQTNYPKIWLHLDEEGFIQRSGFFYELSELIISKLIFKPLVIGYKYLIEGKTLDDGVLEDINNYLIGLIEYEGLSQKLPSKVLSKDLSSPGLKIYSLGNSEYTFKLIPDSSNNNLIKIDISVKPVYIKRINDDGYVESTRINDLYTIVKLEYYVEDLKPGVYFTDDYNIEGCNRNTTGTRVQFKINSIADEAIKITETPGKTVKSALKSTSADKIFTFSKKENKNDILIIKTKDNSIISIIYKIIV